MSKLKVRVKRNGTRFELVDDFNVTYYGVQCISMSPIDSQGQAEVSIKVEVDRPEEWKKYVLTKKIVKHAEKPN